MKRKPTNPITNVRTGNGDNGFTFLREQGVKKNSHIVNFVGDLDEACAALGYVEVDTVHISCEMTDLQMQVIDSIERTKSLMFEIGAMVHSEDAKNNHIGLLEQYTQYVSEIIQETIAISSEIGILEPLRGFIFPSSENANEMFARAVIRRAERSAITAECEWAVQALNVASDLMFVIAWFNSRSLEQWVGFEN